MLLRSFGTYIVFYSISNGLDDGYDRKLFPAVCLHGLPSSIRICQSVSKKCSLNSEQTVYRSYLSTWFSTISRKRQLTPGFLKTFALFTLRKSAICTKIVICNMSLLQKQIFFFGHLFISHVHGIDSTTGVKVNKS